MQNLRLYLPLLLSLMISCSPQSEKGSGSESRTESTKGITSTPFGTLKDGSKISLYTLRNSNGAVVKVMNYGGIITSFEVPDKNGNLVDVVLGYDSLAQYEKRNPFFGALVGRYGNRIANAKFSLDGVEYELAKNNNGNHIHGGTKGFDKVVWAIEEAPSSDGVAIKLSYLSKDMEEGYPGNLNVEVTYTLTDDNAFQIDYKATTDKKTIVNLTQHAYFNLNGNKSDVLNHEISINGDQLVAVNEALIPKGELMPVEDTPFDFRTPFRIGERIDNDHEQLRFGKGYDHCWVINGQPGGEARPAAEVYDPMSGIEMTVYTTEPGIQFYTGNFLDGTITGKNGVVYNKRSGFCLETQHFPDSPNQSQFPSVVVSPGETYTSRTIYQFGVRK